MNLMRNVIAIAICLAVTTMFWGCDQLEKLLSDKQITAFGFLSPAAVGVIDESAKTITVNVPAGTDVTALTPSITVSTGATVNPASGVVNNFTNPATYTVTAEDGSKAVYVVTVIIGTGGSGGEQPNGNPQELKGYIGESRTLPDLGFAIDYIVPSWIEFNNNAVITIEPGVCIAFKETGGSMSVREGATIKMLGTAAKPIQFRGAGATSGTEKGSWGYIDITTNSDNIMQYVECINGGKDVNNGVIRVSSQGQLSMSNCKINGSLGLGVTTSGSSVIKKFESNVIENCNKQPVHLGNISQAGVFDETSTLSNNNDKFISISAGYLENDNLTIKPTTVPYQFDSWIDIEKILTVNAGTKFLMNTGSSISVRDIGCLKMLGSAERPIQLSGYVNSTEKGSWGYIDISTNNDNQLQYVEMVNGGNSTDYGVLRLSSSGKASINNCTINGSKGHGINTSSSATITSFVNNRISACNHSPVWLGNISQTAAFDNTSNLTGNTEDYIGISSGYLDDANLTTKATTVPYYFSSWIEVEKLWTVTDATFYLHADATLSVRNLGRINATGCRFDRLPDMGYQYPSISLGGNNGSSFINCTFEHGAKNSDSGIVNIDSGAEMSFTNCKFQNTSQYGVRINNSSANVTGSGNTFTNCTKGNVRLYNGQTSNTF
jgi:hypothetical protein